MTDRDMNDRDMDDMGVDEIVDGMGVDGRFAAWLRRVAADYHRPPDTPAEAMWPRIEAGWREATVAEEPGRSVEDLSDEALSVEAADYHRPPDTPAEAMWPRIEAAWRMRARLPAGAREAGLESPDAAPDSGRTRGRRTGRRAPWAWAVGLAATLVLGIAIGRQSVSELERQGASPIATATRPGGGDAGPSGAAAGSGAAATAAGEGIDGEVGNGASPGELREGAAGAAGPEAAGNARAEDAGAGTRPRNEGARDGDPREGAASGPALAAGEGPTAGEPSTGAGVAYRAAAADHFGRAEVFLTSFRSGDSAEATVASRWARELLLDTRLLMDWAGDDDPRLTMLLGELELVLAQIAALGNDGAADERAMIVDGMETRDVLPRLRSAIPAGPAGTYLQGV